MSPLNQWICRDGRSLDSYGAVYSFDKDGINHSIGVYVFNQSPERARKERDLMIACFDIERYKREVE